MVTLNKNCHRMQKGAKIRDKTLQILNLKTRAKYCICVSREHLKGKCQQFYSYSKRAFAFYNQVYIFFYILNFESSGYGLVHFDV